jgi:hypothetical protein
VLPRGVMKVRHYGIFSPLCQSQTAACQATASCRADCRHHARESTSRRKGRAIFKHHSIAPTANVSPLPLPNSCPDWPPPTEPLAVIAESHRSPRRNCSHSRLRRSVSARLQWLLEQTFQLALGALACAPAPSVSAGHPLPVTA